MCLNLLAQLRVQFFDGCFRQTIRPCTPLNFFPADIQFWVRDFVSILTIFFYFFKLLTRFPNFR